MKTILENIEIDRVLDAVAAGTTEQTTAIIDMAEFSNAAFVVSLGGSTISATCTIKVQGGDASDMSDAVDIKDASVSFTDPDGTSYDNTTFAVEVTRQPYRYLRAKVVRGVANITIDNVTALKYGKIKVPVAYTDLKDKAIVAG